MNNNFKHNIFKFQVIIMLIPLSIISFVQYDLTKKELESEHLQFLDTKSQHVSSLLDVYADSIKTNAVLIGQSALLSQLVNDLKDESYWDPNDTEESLNYPNNNWGDLRADKDINEIINLRDFARNIFSTLKAEHSYIGNIEIFNLNAVVIMRGHRDFRGDLKKDQFVLDAINGQSSSGFLVSKRTGQPAIDGIASIRYNGEIVGAVKIGMYITEQVAIELERQTEIEIVFFDKDVFIDVLDYQDSSSVSNTSQSVMNLSGLEMLSRDEQLRIRINPDIYKTYTLKGLSYTNLYNETNNENYAIRINPVFDYKHEVIGANMILLKNDILFYKINKIGYNNIRYVIIIFVLVIIFSLIFSNKIGNPILNLKDQIRNMKEGDRLDSIQNIYGPQELIEMAFEFNSLIDAIVSEREKNEKLIIISTLDGLTNLFNHKKFYIDLESCINQNKLFSVIFFDLDRFKLINDNLGHSVGDKILRELSNILKSFENNKNYECRAYRYGGEEFSVLLKGKNKSEAFIIAEEIRVQVMNSHQFDALTGELSVTISAGISSYPIDSTFDNDLVDYADRAMYYSKNNGRNRTTVYESKLKS